MEYFSKIVHIDIDENVQSIIERFLPLDDHDIIFAVPTGARVFQNISELKLLKQAVDSSNKNIVLVSQDEAGMELAHDIGFQVEREFLELLSPAEDRKYLAKTHQHPKISDIVSSVPLNKAIGSAHIASAEDLQKRSLSSTGDLKNQKIDSEMAIFIKKTEEYGGGGRQVRKKFPTLVAIVVFIVISLAIGGISLATLLPRVTVKITPRKETVSLDLLLIADKAISQVDIAKNKIPVQIITVEKEKTLEFSASGKTDVASKASGAITVYNKQTSQQALMATTRFESMDGKIFRTPKAIIIPAEGSLEVAVVADKVGSEYNMAPGEFTLPGFKGGQKFDIVYGKSASAMQGGSDGAGSAVTLSDIENAKKEIEKQLIVDAEAELLKEKEELPQSRNLTFIKEAIDIKIISENISAMVGTSAQKFSATMKIIASAFLFQEKSVDEIIKENVKTKIARNNINFGEIRKSYSNIKTDFNAGTLSFKVKAEQDATPVFNTEELQKLFAGKDGEQIREYILENNAMEGAEISFWPFWVKKAPKNPNKIEIVY